MSKQHVGELICQYYSLTTELERLFPKRSFMPDAHVVESFCEVLAAADFDLELLPASTYKDSLLELCLFAVARSF